MNGKENGSGRTARRRRLKTRSTGLRALSAPRCGVAANLLRQREAQAPLSAPLSLSYIHLRRQDVTEERNLARRRPRHSGRHKRGRSAERRAPAGFTKGKRPPPPILFLPVSPQKGEAVCCTLCAPRRHFGQRELNFLSFRLSEGQEARRSCRMSLPRLSLCPLP